MEMRPSLSLETARLFLRPCKLQDLDAMHRIRIDPEIRRFLWDNDVISRAQAEAALRASLDSFKSERLGIWAISVKGSLEIIGFCGMRRTEDSGEVELLYGVRPEMAGRGIASEAAAAVLRYGLQQIGLGSIVARADEANLASVRVMQKIGMAFRRKYIEPGRVTVEYAIARNV